MKINCICCNDKIQLKEEVVLDVANSLYHANCYSEFSENLFEWKDFGGMEDILNKYNYLKS
ncbi:hypothetical protein K7887_03130 [Sutcliffiella horikoshii]|uniref:hypothetical protein n=1 Tax=Sutcliffiella horikoshii TaxID=79883 RepID=UPI001CBD7CAD|nr:hypothetical protein [Sutcliffiella horikoshii]UAL47975.1 hypothetical protein K7887_03130 [Sutcliffiella horikoshii]